MEEYFNESIKVYIKVNEKNDITRIGSSIFLNDVSGWIKIDEGYGDKFAHAQSQYFDKPLQSENGKFNFKYINGEVVGLSFENEGI